MCGIVGAYAFDGFEKKSEEKQRIEASIFITTQLLQMTVDRGKDATGISLLWADGNFNGLKMGISAPDFIARFGEEETEFKGMLKLWREYPKLYRVFMGHCRKASKGNSYDNANNHPLQVGDMVFIHNGTLSNDEIIFEKMKIKRSAEVDSEAIGHLLQHYTKNGSEPFTKEVLEETTKRLDGTYSVIAVSGNNPFQVAQFRDGRPAELVLIKPLKTVFVASEKKYLQNVLYEYNKHVQLFSPISLPYLKKSDVEFKTMSDDSYLIWDLTTPITDETSIEDLYNWGKLPGFSDKMWKTPTKTYNNSNTNAYNMSKKTVAATSVDSNKTHSGTGKSGPTTIHTDTTSDSGVIWSKGLNKYKTNQGIETTKKYGAVEIDIDKGEINYLAPTEDGDVLNKIDKDRIENLIVGAAKIEEVALVRATNAIEDVKKNSPGPENDTKNVVEVDMTTCSPEAIKKADEHCVGLAKFADIETVASELDLDDVSVLKALPIHALTNRIMKKLYAKAFAEGYDAGAKKAQIQGGEKIVKAEKLNAAEKKLRTMKMFLKIMGYSLSEIFDAGMGGYEINSNDLKDTFMDGLADVIKPAALKRLDIKKIFSVGDLTGIPMISKLVDVIEEESKK